MCSAQISGFSLGRDYIGDENLGAHHIDELAKGSAGLSQGWSAVDILLDGDTVELAKASAGARIRAIECPKKVTRAADALVYNRPNKGGAPPHCSVQIGGVGRSASDEGRLFRGGRHAGRNIKASVSPKCGASSDANSGDGELVVRRIGRRPLSVAPYPPGSPR